MKRRSLVVGAAGASGLAALAAPLPRDAAPLAGDAGPIVGEVYAGMHFHRLLPEVGARVPTRWPAAQIGAIRLWDATTRWADIAPQRDRWDFDRLDAHVELAEAGGVPVLYTLGSTPRWASARPDEPGPYGPGCAAEPRLPGDWQDYVTRVASRYRGRIAAYEVWNEPYFSELAADRGQPTFFSGSVAQMVEMTRIAREAIRSVDPAARLATPGFVNGPHRLGRFLDAGGAALVDVAAYHFYARDSAQFLGQIDEVRSLLARRGLAQLPLWNTECGVEGAAPPSTPSAEADADRAAAARLAQFLILGAAAGLDRFYYYAWDNDRTGMVDRQGTANARAPAWRQARRWLLGTRLTRPVAIGRAAFRVDATRGGQRFSMAWAEREAILDLQLSNGWRIVSAETLFGEAVAIPPAGAAPRSLMLGPAPLRLVLARGSPA